MNRLNRLIAPTFVLATSIAAPAFAKGGPITPPGPQNPALQSCSSTDMTGYLDCHGATIGNINAQSTFQFGSSTYAFAFDTNLTGSTSGTVSFSSAIKGKFVLGIKAGDGYSTYLFDGGSTGISSLNWDTKGIFLNANKQALGLSHMAVYTTPAVPEPESLTLAAGGLGVVGLVLRRRRK